MPTFKIRAEQVVTYEIIVEADTLDTAITSVEAGEERNLFEIGRDDFKTLAFIAPGGFDMWEELE
jgi:hypothetical protein